MGSFSKWVSTWGNAVSIVTNKPEGYAKDITLRYSFTSAFEGDCIRLTFDNYCGTEDVVLSKVCVYDGHEFKLLSFGGEKSVTIKATENVVSDELLVSVDRGQKFFVSIYLGEYTQMRSGVVAMGPLSDDACYGKGDLSECESFPIDISMGINTYYFLSNVSVRTKEENRAVVCYGDSITAQDWPDYLMVDLLSRDENVSVVRRATSGSRILREYSCLTYESYGLKGDKRFCHEVPTDGADTVIIQQGINDIIHPVGEEVNVFRPMTDLPTVEELVDGLKSYINSARSLGYKVFVGTLLPIKGWRTYAKFRDELRCAYNDWIRSTDLIDGYIDFDKALMDAADNMAFESAYDSGDHLHPSKAGYKRMSDEVISVVFDEK